ncbi:LmbE-like protein [Guyanagaster necrorhizus]|uniref:N-acetylglucosaminylphosphatidylinositol deacetylase n=1 Tax=Guyanagaster necrorhizus TaxID=856835 RepID=A0A9P7VYE3_9AGAR|nr:LmbE-like protein [Guyanagaster necrorhizus MCA 3950]KAG7448740.1 LmbE-like protein [Guyanagaster necrorhizus MCA 3950]
MLAINAIIVALIPLLCAVLYLPTASENALNLPSLKNENFLFLTAHPDDECMFFAPTIISLLPHVQVHVLSLSTGNADGLGDIRRTELMASLDVLGVKEGNRHVVDHPALQDNITMSWGANIISDILGLYVSDLDITTILTFDRAGVSGHPNHRSLPEGVKHFIETTAVQPPPKFFALISVPTSTKYVGIFAPLLAKFDLSSTKLLHSVEAFWGAPGLTDTMPVFVAGVKEYLTAHRAMRAHKSQLVWFRRLYVLFSRYMWVNEWHLVRLQQ